ncbi:MAG: hypothetical protein ACXVCV_18660 [Polyangia bacterium]
MGARTARIGFVGYAVTLLALVGVGFWNAHLMSRIGHDLSSGLDWQLKILGAVYLSLEVLAITALLFMSRVPVATRARRTVIAAAIVAGVAMVVGLAQRLVLDGRMVSYERIETMLRIVNVATSILYASSEILIGVAGLRIAAAVKNERLRVLAMAAMVARAIVLALQLVPARFGWLVWIHRADDLLLAGLCVALALVVTTIGEPEATLDAGGDERLAAGWRAPADGITLYLGAGVARVVCALLTWVVMYGARSAQGTGDLRDVRAQLLVVAALSAMATIAMLVALWRISSAPLESRASGPALVALTLALMAFGLDVWGTWVTADALDGNVSAAFFAMDALPIIGGIGALLGLGVATSLLIALGNLATALGRVEVAARARGAIGYVLAAGVLLGVALTLTRKAELMLVVAVIALPLAIAALVQFLRVALAVGREIRERL